MANEGKLQKMEVDYSSTVDEKVPECEKLAKSGKLSEAIGTLLALEKQTRTGCDAISTGRLLVAIVKMCFDAKKLDQLNEQIILLTKRRGQLKQAVTKMVQEACTYVEKITNQEQKLKLIDTLRTVTAGKIYVEIERARLTRTLAEIREADGRVSDAAEVLQELQVETFGSMEKREKVDFILEQMRLCLARRDFIRTQIISKKINTKFFDEPSTHDLKLKYYKLMIELDQYESSYLEICKHFRAIADISTVSEDTAKRHEALSSAVLYLILAPYDNEQSDMLHRIKGDKGLEELPMYMELHRLFTTMEIMRWKELCEKYEQDLRSDTTAGAIFSTKSEAGAKRWKDLRSRVVEHNIRVLALYYTRIRMSRMAELLDLTEAEAEEFLSQLVVSKTVQARMDRLAGIVQFQRARQPTDVLNDWSSSVTQLMKLVNNSTHLITKEEMMHRLH